MDDEIINAVFGNVGSICSFRVGISDASFLVNQFKPEFDEHDLLNLPIGHTYLKTMVNGIPQPPFSLNVTADEIKKPGNKELAAMIKKLSSLKYGRPREIVESDIGKRAKL